MEALELQVSVNRRYHLKFRFGCYLSLSRFSSQTSCCVGAGIILCAKLGLATEFISSSNPMEYISQRDQDGSIYRHNVTQRDLRQYLTPDMFFEGQMCARMAMRDSLQKILVDVGYFYFILSFF